MNDHFKKREVKKNIKNFPFYKAIRGLKRKIMVILIEPNVNVKDMVFYSFHISIEHILKNVHMNLMVL